MSVTAGVSDTIIALREKLRGKIGQTKVKRYWPGKAPVWAKEDEEEEDVMIHKAVVLDCTDDPRLRRLAQARIENREEVRADHRRIRRDEIIYTDQEKELSNQESRDEEHEEERRRIIRENNLKRPHEKAIEEEEELKDEDEYETDDSEEDEIHVITMIKPFFVLKDKRDTIAEREELEAKEKALKELAKRKIRKIETKQIVVEEVKKDEEIWKKMVFEEASIEDVETDDDINEAEEYEVWRTREIARIKRERNAKEAMLRVQ